MRQAAFTKPKNPTTANFSGTQTGNTGPIYEFFVSGEITGKELDQETGLYYYGARYLDPKTSRWLSGDPALGDYIPNAPINDDVRRKNGNLPGQGGVFNYVNLHVYHYAANNPVKYVDPDGREIEWEQKKGVTRRQMNQIKREADKLMNSGTEAGRRFKELHDSKDVKVTINVNASGDSNAYPLKPNNTVNGVGSGSVVNININDSSKNTLENTSNDVRTTLAHEVSGHAYDNYKGTSSFGPGKQDLADYIRSEQNAVAMENEYRDYLGLLQRPRYGPIWDMPLYNSYNNSWAIRDKSQNIIDPPFIRWRPRY